MNLIEPIHQHAQSRPNDPAIITPQGTVSWSQLDKLIWSTALTLNENGLIAGDRVGITMAHPVIHLVTSLALARIGVAHIAVSLSESDLVRDWLIEKLELKRILTDTGKVVSASQNTLLLNRLGITEINQDQKQKLGSIGGELTWLILQSSGTTGKKKYAELTHRSAQFRSQRLDLIFNFQSKDVFWSGTSQDFTAGKQAMTFCLIAGTPLCLTAGLLSFNDTPSYLSRCNVTIGVAIPSKINSLLNLDNEPPRFRKFFTGSTFVSRALRESFEEKTGCFLTVGYGTNEVSWFTQTVIDQTDGLITNNVGCPVDHQVKIEIVDENNNKLTPGEIGEIRIKAPGLVDSYLTNPEASRRSFKNGWFHPGDLGYLTKEGSLFLQGRKDDMMIFDGINIYPAEIENVLSSHPAVDEVAAFAAKHERFQDVPVAAVTLKELVSEKDLIDYCKVPLGIKHPKRIFVLKEFPRNTMGKILKRELSAVVRKEQN